MRARQEPLSFVLRAELRFWHRFPKKVINQIQIMAKGNADAMGEIRLLFWIVPPVRNEDQDFSASVVMIDNFNRRHRVGRVMFKSPKTRNFPD